MLPTCQLQQDSTEDGRAGTDARLILQCAGGLTPGIIRRNKNIKYDGCGMQSEQTVFCIVVGNIEIYQSVQPVMDIRLKLCVIQDSANKAEKDADGLLQGLEGTRLSLAARVI